MDFLIVTRYETVTAWSPAMVGAFADLTDWRCRVTMARVFDGPAVPVSAAGEWLHSTTTATKEWDLMGSFFAKEEGLTDLQSQFVDSIWSTSTQSGPRPRRGRPIVAAGS